MSILRGAYPFVFLVFFAITGCGICLKESSDPPETEKGVQDWKSQPRLTPIWNRRITRVCLRVDAADDAIPFPETVAAMLDLLRKSLGSGIDVEASFGEPMTAEGMAPYLEIWKIYVDLENRLRVRIPPEVEDDRKYLEDVFLSRFAGARTVKPGSGGSGEFGRENARGLAAQMVLEGTSREIDYDRLFGHLEPRRVPEGTYLIHVWSDTFSRSHGGGSSTWSPDDPGILRLERTLIERQAVLHISTRTLERSSALHELGHLLGLVQNPSHHRSGHCTNPACIMYPGVVNTRTVLANFFTGLVGQPKSSFCGECEKDLDRYREVLESAPD